MSSPRRPAGDADAAPDGPRPASDALYQEEILAHYRRPQGRGALPDPDASGTASNALCGEEMTVTVTLAPGAEAATITDARYTGDGCSLATASASMMTGIVGGMTTADVERLVERLGALVAGTEADPEALPRPLRAFAAVRRSPARAPCVLLPWRALQAALVDRQSGRTGRRN